VMGGLGWRRLITGDSHLQGKSTQDFWSLIGKPHEFRLKNFWSRYIQENLVGPPGLEPGTSPL
jgi:hypothetical protein